MEAEGSIGFLFLPLFFAFLCREVVFNDSSSGLMSRGINSGATFGRV